MAYFGDVFSSKSEKQEELGFLVNAWVLWSSGGVIFAILMEGTGLFVPLWVGAALVFFFGVSTVETPY
jgi:hypothetical protein